jgi:hypothetical protein
MIEQLKLYDVKSPKVRLGNEWDGGYVVPQLILDSSAALFSYGVGSDISFEIDYVRKTNKPSFSYDHTVEGAGIPHDLQNLMMFKKEGLSYQKETDLDTFFTHYEQSGIKEKVFLKMDIEGAEFPFFLNCDMKRLSEIVVGIVVEFHPVANPRLLQDYFDSLKKINDYFYHCHIHCNNYGGSSSYSEYNIEITLPHIIEMTFINKSLVSTNQSVYSKLFNLFKIAEKIELDMNDYPNPEFDRKNDLNKPEHSLSFIKLINKL